MKYAEDQDAFFKDYAEAHLKLSELGTPTFGHCLNVVSCTYQASLNYAQVLLRLT